MSGLKKTKALWLLLLPLLLFGALLLVRSSEDSPLEERGLQVREIDDPEGTTREIVTVAPESIPTTMRERQEAPSIALLPHRTGHPEMQGERSLPPGEARAVKNFAEEFLRTWESYDPGDLSYEKRLRPFVDQENASAIAARSDSVDHSGVCPTAGCSRGSTWYESGRFADSAFLVDWQDPFVYLVAYGALRYNVAGDPDGSTERSYGLLLRKSDTSWVVERVAAESLR